MMADNGNNNDDVFVYMGGDQEVPEESLMSASINPSKLFLRGHSIIVQTWCQ